MMSINTLKRALVLITVLLTGYSRPGWSEYRVELKPRTTVSATLSPGMQHSVSQMIDVRLYDENGALIQPSALPGGYTYCIDGSISGGIPADTGQALFGNYHLYITGDFGAILTKFCPETHNFYATATEFGLGSTWTGAAGNVAQQDIQGALNLTMHLKYDNKVVSSSSATAPFRVMSGVTAYINNAPQTINKIQSGTPTGFDFEINVQGSPDAPDVSWELTSGPCDSWSPALSTKQSPAETIPPDGLQTLKAEVRYSHPDKLSIFYPLTARFTPAEAGAFSCTAILTLAFP